MSRIHLILTLAVLSFIIGRNANADDVFPAERLVFFSDGGPVLLHIDLSISGRKLVDYRRSFVETKFAQLDADSSGMLEDAEAVNVPTLGLIQSGAPAVLEKWTELDKAPEDGKLSLSELTTHYEAAMGKPFQMTRRVKEQFQEVDLFSKIDTDGDHAVSTTELGHGLDTLIKLDLDDDETISAAELAPLFDPSNREVAITTTEDAQEAYPFLLLAGEANLDLVAKKVVDEYDREVESRKDGALSENEIPAVWKSLRRSDRNRDEKLTVEEIKAAFKSEIYPVKVTIRMPNYGTARVDAEGTASTRITSSRRDVTLGNQAVKFVANKWSTDVSHSISFYKVDFLRKDRDKNSYLDANEFGALNIPNATFEACDLDNDKKIFVSELEGFLLERTTLSRCQLVMRIENDRQSLFQILDKNLDRRLSRREFLEGYSEMLKHDTSQDGQLSSGELESRYKVTIELARTALFQARPNRMASSNATSPRLEQSTEGPEWFRRMDVNRDGDVTRREFLGPLRDFDELDENGDGFLTALEAQSED